MIDHLLAQKFIDKIASYTSHNVNIINEQGIIIAASKDVGRCKTFHETAYEMLQTGTNVISVSETDSYLGVHPGVNMLLTCKGNNMGVVGVTGTPEEIYDIALIIKMSLETMMEYELQHEQIQERKNITAQFLNALLYSEEKENLHQLPSLARELGYQENLLRIPLLITSDRQEDWEECLHLLHSSPLHHSQDMLLITRDRQLLIFKYFEEPLEKLFSHYTEYIEEYLSVVHAYASRKGSLLHTYAGSFQNRISSYRYAYRHCIWLRQSLNDSAHETDYFYAHIQEYLLSQVPFLELHHIYQPLPEVLGESFQKNLTETIEALQRHNYNFNTCSRDLYIHKNTLVFRFNKIKNYFNLNPVQNTPDRNFLGYLAYYLRHRESK